MEDNSIFHNKSMNSQKHFPNFSVEKTSASKLEDKAASFLNIREASCTKNSSKETPVTESRPKNIILQTADTATQKKKRLNKVDFTNSNISITKF